MRITFVSASLSSGGAERVLVSLAKGFAQRGHEVAVITLNGTEHDFYALPAEIYRSALNINTLVQSLMGLGVLRAAIKSTVPSIVISFIDQTNVMTLIATRGLAIPVVVSERVDPAAYRIGMLWNLLRNVSYRWADCIVVQTERARGYFLPHFEKRTVVIPNPIVETTVRSTQAMTLERPCILAIGRLCWQKGFDLLLRAFATLQDRYPRWSLLVLGEGPERKSLEGLCETLGLRERVMLIGRVKNPSDFMRQADLFVLSSRFEGFPNALCEAMAAGLPVISTDCPSGPREIIENGQNGLLVLNQNIAALSEAMDGLMSDGLKRKNLGDAAQAIVSKFSLDKILGRWEDEFRTLLNERKKK